MYSKSIHTYTMDKTHDMALCYPTGKFQKPEAYTPELRQSYVERFIELPGLLRQATHNLNDEQLDTPYRKDGWTPRKIVHHLADSHINSFSRFKTALTEDHPTIKTYNQDKWIEGSDATLGIKPSLDILEGVHARLSHLTANMSVEEWGRKLYHPEMKTDLTLNDMGALYAWHGKHHLTQITELKKRMNR